MKKAMTRDEKIKLLNGLKAGKLSINKIFPRLPEHWIFEIGRGIYSRHDQELSENQFEAMQKTKGKSWLYNILKFNERTGEDFETITNCENFEWPLDAPPPFDDKQVKKIIAAVRLEAQLRETKLKHKKIFNDFI